VLAAGPGAVLSHRDAAALHGIRPPGNHRRTEVTTPARAASTPRLQIHRTTTLDPRDATAVGGIPVTSIARTLVDLAGTVPPRHLAKALDEAERQHLLDVRALGAALERTRQRHGPGHARLRAALQRLATTGAQPTESELEDAFLALVDAHDLPQPRTNHRLHGFKVDACWPAHRLVVELDGWAFHYTRRAFEQDRERANVLQTHGWRVLRFTYGHVVRHPAGVAATVAAALAR
jgi:very-short-patch-repair endonuclease